MTAIEQRAQDLIDKADRRFRAVDPSRTGRYAAPENYLSVLMDTWDAIDALVTLARDLGADVALNYGEDD